MPTDSNAKTRIPGLFRLIIKNHEVLDTMRSRPVVSFALWKEAREREKTLRSGAERFIKRQRGGSGATI